MARFVRTAERRGWSERKKMDRLFDCLSEKALEYANRSKAETYEALRRELDLRFDLKDAPVAAKQRLHVVRQEDEESLEDFLQRVLTITMDGFDKAEVGTPSGTVQFLELPELTLIYVIYVVVFIYLGIFCFVFTYYLYVSVAIIPCRSYM